MKNQAITIIICGFLPFALMIISAILGTIYRLKTADKIMQGAREGLFKELSNPHKVRSTRIRAAVALICLVLFSSILVLTITKLLPSWMMLIGLLFAITGSICAYLNYKEVIPKN